MTGKRMTVLALAAFLLFHTYNAAFASGTVSDGRAADAGMERTESAQPTMRVGLYQAGSSEQADSVEVRVGESVQLDFDYELLGTNADGEPEDLTQGVECAWSAVSYDPDSGALLEDGEYTRAYFLLERPDGGNRIRIEGLQETDPARPCYLRGQFFRAGNEGERYGSFEKVVPVSVIPADASSEETTEESEALALESTPPEPMSPVSLLYEEAAGGG